MTMGQGLSVCKVQTVPEWLHSPVQAATLAVQNFFGGSGQSGVDSNPPILLVSIRVAIQRNVTMFQMSPKEESSQHKVDLHEYKLVYFSGEWCDVLQMFSRVTLNNN